MADVILSTPSISVLGGPATVRLETDFGAPGKRGSSIIFVNGNPNTNPPTNEDVQLLDLAINVLASDPEYQYLYQYQSVDGNNVWVRQISLASNGASFQASVDFENGVGEFNLPVSLIPNAEPSISAESVSVQITAQGSPQALLTHIGMLSKFVDTDDVLKIKIPIYLSLVSPTGALTGVEGNSVIHFLVSLGSRYGFDPLP